MRYADNEAPSYQIHDAILEAIEALLRKPVNGIQVDKYLAVLRGAPQLHRLEIGLDVVCRVQKHGMVIAYKINRDKHVEQRMEWLYECHYANPRFNVDDVAKSIAEFIAREYGLR